MPQPNVLILRAPGTNCDLETAFAFEKAGAATQRVHVNRLLEKPDLFEAFQILCIPGGFSYGDDVAAGRILANQIEHHLGEQIARFKDAGKLILGICNGFQVLIKLGVLFDGKRGQVPLADHVAEKVSGTICAKHPSGRGRQMVPDTFSAPFSAPATLTWNDSGRFEDRWVRLGTDGTKCVFLKDIDQMYLPVAHAEGKFVVRDEETLRRLDAAGQLALRYLPLNEMAKEKQGVAGAKRSGAPEAEKVSGTICAKHPSGRGRQMVPDTFSTSVPFPDNPNGSQADVAGVCDATGRVLGIMPHPERHVTRTQHPRWTRPETIQTGDGLKMFQNAVGYFA